MENFSGRVYALLGSAKLQKARALLQDGFAGMYAALKLLCEADDDGRELCAGDISAAFGVSTARTAVVLSALEKKGWVRKGKSPTDGRKTLVRVTETGRAALETRLRQVYRLIEELLGGLSEAETEALLGLLQKLFGE